MARNKGTQAGQRLVKLARPITKQKGKLKKRNRNNNDGKNDNNRLVINYAKGEMGPMKRFESERTEMEKARNGV